MKAILENKLTFNNVNIIGRWSGLGEMVEWITPAENVNALDLLGITEAGFRFAIKGDICYMTSRIMCTKFLED